MPTIKRETSPELPIGAVASVGPLNILDGLSEARFMRATREDRNVKAPLQPLRMKPYLVAKQAHLRPGAYQGSSPRKYKLAALSDSTSRRNASTPPGFSRLPSRLGLAIATGRVNKTTAARTTTAIRTTTPQLPSFDRLTKHLERIPNATEKKPDKMDENSVGNGDVFMDGADIRAFPPISLKEHDDETVAVSHTQWEELQYHVHLLQNAHAASEKKVVFQGSLIMELVSCNQRTHTTIEDLNARLRTLENLISSRLHQNHIAPATAFTLQPPIEFRPPADARSRSPSPDHEEYRLRDASAKPKKARKDLEIKIPDKKNAPLAMGLPTPRTFSKASIVRMPNTPLTPGRVGPPNSAKRVSTCISKRGIHNLDKMVPPSNAQVPFLPLTDTEIIVYFFNSLCRPIVSLRLYARGWGPAAISDAINTHRVVVPAYLRNTCSVKCTTAIKKGVEKWGEDWDVLNRTKFQVKGMTDDKATDLIKIQDDEFTHTVDYDLRDLCEGLQKHPNKEDGGIFTRCVRYCQEHNAPYKLSNVWELAQDLATGSTPRLFAEQSQ